MPATHVEGAAKRAPVVSRADNLTRLKRIDASITDAVKSVHRGETSAIGLSSRIVAAGVQMLAIVQDDPEEWETFKKTNPKTKELACKGKDEIAKASREVATLIWRDYRTAKSSRERISLYGKAIVLAKTGYWDKGVTKPAKLIEHVTSAGGVKGMIKMSKVPSGKAGPKIARIHAPKENTLFLVRPNAKFVKVPGEIAVRVFEELGESGSSGDDE